MAKVKWTVARHMYYSGIVLAHEAKLGNRFVSIENLGKDYKEINKYEKKLVHGELQWRKVGEGSFERIKEAKADGERWLTE